MGSQPYLQNTHLCIELKRLYFNIFLNNYAGKECFRTFALVAFNAGQSIK